ncbi:putative A-kinase-interacting protein 1 [Apostichopus japonicus]|uniref:Putative A-kinase-interacting protein 1 n=2 Tax=Stichopus japonicus TaxID=307972 RepID=A0A2G8KVJ1_STIJA|nr:putative A-kinase-interacting protein 1 [Apostichopus japonicus]
MSCTLCRSGRQGVSVLQRAQRRKVEWPEKPDQLRSPVEENLPYTTIDEAFESMLQYMSTSSRQCKRFFVSSPPHTHNSCDKNHCSRFHSPQYPYRPQRHPLQQSENMNILVTPGTYAVTAGAWGRDSQQTHVVRLDPGQSVNLDFNL